MDIRDFLGQLDLDEKESAAYLACLELGEGPIMPLVRKTGIVRTTLLYVLEKLESKGLIQVMQHPTHRRYLPLAPRGLAALLRQKEAGMRHQAEALEAALPDLNRLYASTPFQPRIRVYKDLELREVYEDMLLQPINEICYVGDTSNIAAPVGDAFLRGWIRRRVAKQIRSKAIRIRRGEQDIPEYAGTTEMLRTIRYAPEGLVSPAVIYVYGDNVAMVTNAAESFAVVTTSRDYARSIQGWFNVLWSVSKES